MMRGEPYVFPTHEIKELNERMLAEMTELASAHPEYLKALESYGAKKRRGSLSANGGVRDGFLFVGNSDALLLLIASKRHCLAFAYERSALGHLQPSSPSLPGRLEEAAVSMGRRNTCTKPRHSGCGPEGLAALSNVLEQQLVPVNEREARKKRSAPGTVV